MHFKKYIFFAILSLFVGVCAYDVSDVEAATLRLSPDTGVYTTGTTFTMRVMTNTQGQPINAAEGDITFNSDALSVVSISKVGSIFTLWTREPEFSNGAGKIYFGGGSPSGYTGSAGTIMTVTFRVKNAGTAHVTYAGGSILAADGRGTNILSNMQGASYTLQAVASVPPPEYVPPPNTPLAPKITSETHPDQTMWYPTKTAKLSWPVPSQSIAVRTLLDRSETGIPTKVYEEPISDITLEDIPEGVSYFHIQFKNADGWGRVAHYRLAVDTQKPESFTIVAAEGNDPGNTEQTFNFNVVETGSGVAYFMVQIDGAERTRFEDTDGKHLFKTPSLHPGEHTMVVEAFDRAGNSIVSSHTFVVEAFEAPVFTEYPFQVSSDVIPVIRGTTRAHAKVMVSMTKIGASKETYEVVADGSGVFTFIPEGRLGEGVYELSAIATDAQGAQSAPSESVRIAVQKPGFVRIGSIVISVLSVVVPLIGLAGLLMFVIWYGMHRMRIMQGRIRKEVTEAEQSLVREFDSIVVAVKKDVEALREARKGRLTKQEEELVISLSRNLTAAEKRIEKEIQDIERVVKR